MDYNILEENCNLCRPRHCRGAFFNRLLGLFDELRKLSLHKFRFPAGTPILAVPAKSPRPELCATFPYEEWLFAWGTRQAHPLGLPP